MNTYKRISNTSTVRTNDSNDRAIHVTGERDVSPQYSTYLDGAGSCDWCHIGAPHSTDAHNAG